MLHHSRGTVSRAVGTEEPAATAPAGQRSAGPHSTHFGERSCCVHTFATENCHRAWFLEFAAHPDEHLQQRGSSDPEGNPARLADRGAVSPPELPMVLRRRGQCHHVPGWIELGCETVREYRYVPCVCGAWDLYGYAPGGLLGVLPIRPGCLCFSGRDSRSHRRTRNASNSSCRLRSRRRGLSPRGACGRPLSVNLQVSLGRA